MKFSEQLKSGVILDNPVFMQTIGLCPTLATTTSLQNAIGMGAAATVVLICSNIVISAMRRIIPDKIRIAAFITIIATFVTFRELLGAGTILSGYVNGVNGIAVPFFNSNPMVMMILPAGGFLMMGFILAAIQKIMARKEDK